MANPPLSVLNSVLGNAYNYGFMSALLRLNVISRSDHPFAKALGFSTADRAWFPKNFSSTLTSLDVPDLNILRFRAAMISPSDDHLMTDILQQCKRIRSGETLGSTRMMIMVIPKEDTFIQHVVGQINPILPEPLYVTGQRKVSRV